MTDIRAMTGRKVQPLDSGWELALSPPQAWQAPGGLGDAVWLPALVPGTAAGALRALGQWSLIEPQPLHDKDVWYRLRVNGQGKRKLRFEGLATFAEVFLDGRLILTGSSMYEPYEVDIGLGGEHWIHIAFRSLRRVLAGTKGPRPRWKTMMIEEPKLRFLRTTLIGHMPGWCPPVDVVGPYRSVLLIEEGTVRAGNVDLRSRLEHSEGVVTVALDLSGVAEGVTPVLHCAGAEASLRLLGAEGQTTRWQGTLRIPDVDLWWPHTHGNPTLHAVTIDVGAVRIDLGEVGFRRVEVDRGADGNSFTLHVNGVRVFCRGACWTPIDVVSLQASDADYARELGLMQAAGLNMLRLSGTMVYETPDFHHLCDRLGIMVWQDAMMANFDYPPDAAFADIIRSEIKTLVRRLGASPSFVVMCGGSEVGQQAAMMGLPRELRDVPLAESVIPEVLADLSDVAYVPGSPSGGALPFVAEAGPSHYYGVGAYLRPLDDARRANVRFASECLAFANLPDDRHFAEHRLDPASDPDRWLAGVPRDGGASWDFDDVREHYLQALWNEDGRSLRHSDPRRWRQLSRAIAAEVIERTIDEWRRPASTTAGALLWLWRDLQPGAGWGLVDCDGRPKSTFYALRRAALPLRLSITDEGTNGLYLHLVNDTPEAVTGSLALRCLRDGKTPVIEAERHVTVAPHSGLSIGAFALFDRFFDAGHCYRFGPAAHDTVHATFAAENSDRPHEAFHFLGPPTSAADQTIAVALGEDAAGFFLDLQVPTATRFVEIADNEFLPDDNYFHMACGHRRIVRLAPPRHASGHLRPSGRVSALTLSGDVNY
ncbi:glycoside hydrolase family 2 protein [Rhodopseudomonas sp. P2A-2r]|uniref:glycoside hydrolase family 2 protein n=1 Tax=Rhodopseudomonas sp. P2A-2r TaxID=2991972 RepID=UPI002234C525|nr:glycoside hydrolase family 2 protein [Rhodopseudomonas sp. P2A-2r]UZE47083.1 glycoside hydrolase family 2 protein [Rhodopseudomonas sp. P2A-2r]